jgi:hypothetical protein
MGVVRSFANQATGPKRASRTGPLALRGAHAHFAREPSRVKHRLRGALIPMGEHMGADVTSRGVAVAHGRVAVNVHAPGNETELTNGRAVIFLH